MTPRICSFVSFTVQTWLIDSIIISTYFRAIVRIMNHVILFYSKSAVAVHASVDGCWYCWLQVDAHRRGMKRAISCNATESLERSMQYSTTAFMTLPATKIYLHSVNIEWAMSCNEDRKDHNYNKKEITNRRNPIGVLSICFGQGSQRNFYFPKISYRSV